MVVTGGDKVPAVINPVYDRTSELNAFDDTKAGVKGLVDAGVTEVPRIFIQPPDNLGKTSNAQFSFPVIDLEGMDEDPIRRKEIIDQVRIASETWGFFQVVNHGIPTGVLEEMLDGVRKFHEQDTEVKKALYTRDTTRKVQYCCNLNLYAPPPANWRDTLVSRMAPHRPNPEELPMACRDILMEYSKQVKRLGNSLFELLSKGLGLNPNHLKDMDCGEEQALVCHYYPMCPQPELTMGISKHADIDFLTVLLQDQIGGLQVLHQNEWVDVPHMPDALVVNIGIFYRQLISNDKFKSIQHRVLANRLGPRVSVACFFGLFDHHSKLYGLIKELVSEGNPSKYRETAVDEFVAHCSSKGLDGTSILLRFKL